ncbi:unnamed protein product, partial [Polarella glacialis]
DHVTMDLYHYVRDLVHNRRPEVEAMKQRVEAAACWFDFYNLEGPCSPYHAVIHDLERKKQAMPKYLHPHHWAH